MWHAPAKNLSGFMVRLEGMYERELLQ
jgi:hypothetical protein